MVEEYRRCVIVERNLYQPKLHPLHLVTDRVKWITKFGECDSPVTVALTKVHHQSATPPKRHLFAVLHLDNCPIDTSTPAKSDGEPSALAHDDAVAVHVEDDFVATQPETALICGQEFLDHYDISLSRHNQFCFAVVTPFPLDKIVLLALTEETFRWANKQEFETGLLVASTCNKSVLFRRDDVLLSEPSYHYGDDPGAVVQRFRELVTLTCGPLRQGVATLSTSVTVVHRQDPELLSLLDRKTHHDVNTNLADIHIRVNDDVINPNLLCGRKSKQSAITCSEQLAKKLKLEDGDWARISLVDSSDDCREIAASFPAREHDRGDMLETDIQASTSISRTSLVRVKPDVDHCVHIERGCDVIGRTARPCDRCASCVELSSTFLFNLKGDDKLLDHRAFAVQVAKCTKPTVYARELHVSLVLSPAYPPSGCFDLPLTNHFRSTRAVRLCDVIAIPVAGDMDFYETADAKSCRCETIYYKVVGFGSDELDPGGYLVDTKHTSVYQEGTCSSYVPHPRALHVREIPGMGKYAGRLRQFILPHLYPSMLDHACTVLVSGQSGSGKRSVTREVCRRLDMHVIEVECGIELVADSSGAQEAKIRELFERAAVYAPCVLVLANIDCVGKNRDSGRTDVRVCAALADVIRDLPTSMRGRDDVIAAHQLPCVVVATARDRRHVAADVRMMMTYHMEIGAPEEDERREMLEELTDGLHLSRDVDLAAVAKQTSGFVLSDMYELVRKTSRATHDRLVQSCAVGSQLSWADERAMCMAGVETSHHDLTSAMDLMQHERADSIGLPKIPDVSWQDIGGLEQVKNDVIDTIQLPLDHPELVEAGLKRSGVLLYGPPGNGKTLLAKAVATQCSLSFLSVKGPELINMYVGQSEENVRRVFQRARTCAPCVVFFDELDALAPNRGRSGDSGGVMDRVVSQLLAELDGVTSEGDSSKSVFVIAASNRPDLIDQALLRPGRFDKLIYVGVNKTHQDRLKVLKAQTRKLNLAPSVRLDAIVDTCPAAMTGADFGALTTTAAMNAVRRRIAQLQAGDDECDDDCEVEHDDFVAASRDIVPSVTPDQLRNYEQIQRAMVK